LHSAISIFIEIAYSWLMKTLSIILIKSLFIFISLSGSVAFATKVTPLVTLKYSPQCILKAVASKLGLELKPASIPAPLIFLQSETPFEFYKEAARTNFGGQYPEGFVNMYVPEGNYIFLNDSAHLYLKERRIDGSLAHEFTHFIQFKYRGENLFNDPLDLLEGEANRVQHWFLDNFFENEKNGGKAADPCL
jgi:hypothetical protein